ncbi:MAG: hypothetical protein CMF46_02955 [Legionellales bacterium]|nr:hypothetical protein [Legionellales bacterium]
MGDINSPHDQSLMNASSKKTSHHTSIDVVRHMIATGCMTVSAVLMTTSLATHIQFKSHRSGVIRLTHQP